MASRHKRQYFRGNGIWISSTLSHPKKGGKTLTTINTFNTYLVTGSENSLSSVELLGGSGLSKVEAGGTQEDITAWVNLLLAKLPLIGRFPILAQVELFLVACISVQLAGVSTQVHASANESAT